MDEKQAKIGLERFDASSFLRSNRNKALGFGAFTLVVITVLVAGAIVPSASALFKLHSEISQKEIMYTKLEQKVDALTKLSQEYDGSKKTFDTLEMIYPANRDFSLVLSYITNLADKYNFNVTSVNFPTKASEDVESLSVLKPQIISINVKGQQVYLIDFLKALEDLPMSPTVARVNYNNQPDKDGYMNYSIQLRTYFIENESFYK